MAIELATGVENARRRVHRIADERDLLLERTDFADCDGAAMERRAEIRADAEIPLVSVAPGREPVARREAGAHDPRVVAAGLQPPGRNDLVSDIFVDLAAVLHDRLRDVDDEGVEQVEKARLAEALGGGCRGAQIDEQQRALLAPRPVVASRREGEQNPGPSRSAIAYMQVSDDGEREGESNVEQAESASPSGR